MRIADDGGWSEGVRSTRGKGRGKGKEEREKKIEKRKKNWLVQVFETQIYTVLSFLEIFYFFLCSKL